MHIMVVAGEPSGDALGARLMAALAEQRRGRVRFSGVGGEAMAAQGLASLFPMAELSVMGIAEVVPRLPKLLGRVEQTAAAALGGRPDALVTIDSPGFNFRLGRRVRHRAFPHIHYGAPTVWAWRPGRARTIAQFLDHLMVLLPFEPPYFEAVGLPVSFVGHPVIESVSREADGASFRERHGLSAAARLLALLPGSRRGEIERLLPVFGEAVRQLAPRVPDLAVVAPTLPPFVNAMVTATSAWPVPVRVTSDEDEKWAAFAASDAALAASGTVTLELALAHVPMVVAYRMNSLTAALARRLVRLDQVSLVNLLLDRPVVPELLQQECTADRLAAEVERVMMDREVRQAQLAAAASIAAQLGAGEAPPSRRAAEVVLEVAAQGPRAEHRHRVPRGTGGL